jgi:YgiT-type zinc finger domain-containing protein
MLKKKNDTYDYGECEICDTPMQEQYIKQDFWIRGELIVIDHILAGVCPQCGEKVVKADIGGHIAELLRNSEHIATAPRISVPVIRFDQKTKIA